MPKVPSGSRPDPMSLEVDRLLAQLSQVGPQPGTERQPSRRTGSGPSAVPRARSAPAATAVALPTRGDLIALWGRTLLGMALGVAMTQWPYPNACGAALFGYLGAVSMVAVTGGWIAFASWRLRNGMAHIVSFILIYWGIVLVAETVLPRIGYAAERASWRCEGPATLHPSGR